MRSAAARAVPNCRSVGPIWRSANHEVASGRAGGDEGLEDQEPLEGAAPTASGLDRPRHAQPAALAELQGEGPVGRGDPRVLGEVRLRGGRPPDVLGLRLQGPQLGGQLEVHRGEPDGPGGPPIAGGRSCRACRPPRTARRPRPPRSIGKVCEMGNRSRPSSSSGQHVGLDAAGRVGLLLQRSGAQRGRQDASRACPSAPAGSPRPWPPAPTPITEMRPPVASASMSSGRFGPPTSSRIDVERAVGGEALRWDRPHAGEQRLDARPLRLVAHRGDDGAPASAPRSTAAVPTPPAAPWTSSRSPMANPACVNRRVVGGGDVLGHRAGLLPRHRGRQRASRRRSCTTTRSAWPRAGQHRHDAVADGEPSGARARGPRPRRPPRGPGMSAGDAGRGRVEPGALEQVGVADAGRPHVDQHLAGAGLGIRVLAPLEGAVDDGDRVHAGASAALAHGDVVAHARVRRRAGAGGRSSGPARGAPPSAPATRRCGGSRTAP